MANFFKQFTKCEICKISHNKGNKHTYSKKHKNAVEIVVSRFESKVSQLKKSLRSPTVHDCVWESGRLFWCPFCLKEVHRHWTSASLSVENGAFLEHISSSEHHRSSYKFWKYNHLNKERRAKVLLEEDAVDKFEIKSEKAMAVYSKEKDAALKKAAAEMKNEEESRFRATWLHGQMVGCSFHQLLKQQNEERPQNTHDDLSHVDPYFKLQRVRTVGAKAPGLNCITLKKVDDRLGNVHTGATPPWAAKDARNEISKNIGPTMESFEKQLLHNKRSKLPATRVGAKFDRTEEASSNWLPTFGRVWNKSRKSHVRDLFMQSLPSSSQETPSTSSSFPSPSAHNGTPNDTSAVVVGYQRKTSWSAPPTNKRIKISNKFL